MTLWKRSTIWLEECRNDDVICVANAVGYGWERKMFQILVGGLSFASTHQRDLFFLRDPVYRLTNVHASSSFRQSKPSTMALRLFTNKITGTVAKVYQTAVASELSKTGESKRKRGRDMAKS